MNINAIRSSESDAVTSTAPTSSTTPASFLTTVRDEIRVRRAERAARKQLERELSTYTTAAELDDLNAMLNRYDDEQTVEIRRVLDRIHAA